MGVEGGGGETAVELDLGLCSTERGPGPPWVESVVDVGESVFAGW